MAKLFIPSFSNNSCVHIQSSDVIRVYDSQPRLNSTISYTDYYIKSSYISNRGEQTFSQYTTLPSCYDNSSLTSNVFYRNDIDSILVIFLILLLICFYFPYRIISRMFGRWLKW